MSLSLFSTDLAANNNAARDIDVGVEFNLGI
jgi:hypothetical protein